MKPTDAIQHPPDWSEAVVGNAIEVRRGISWSKDQEHSTPKTGTVPVIRIGNVQDRLKLDDLLYISGLKPKAIENKRAAVDWSLIVGSNGNRQRVGNTVRITDNSDFLFASFLLAAKPKVESGIIPAYFYRWLCAEQVQAYLSASAEGTTGLNNLSHSFFRAMAIPYPNPDEQVAISRILDVVDTAIGNTKDAIKCATDLKRALMQRVFTEGIRGEHVKKTPIGFIPASWEVKSVSAVVANFEYGLSLPMHPKGTTPILRMGNIQNGDMVMGDLKYVTLPDRLLKRYMLRRGDVLFNRTNSQEHVGKVGIYRSDEQSVFASYLIRLHPDIAQIDNYYLGQLLNSYPTQCRIKRYATPGVQQVNINAKNLGKALLPVPIGATGLEEQRQIAALLELADKRVRGYGPILRALEQLKKTLMHDLLTGTVRVDPTLFKEEQLI